MKPDPLYLTDAEIAARIGLPISDWQCAVTILERHGFPKPENLFCGRRYWPACRAFLDRRYDLGAGSSPANPGLDGEEQWNSKTPARRRA